MSGWRVETHIPYPIWTQLSFRVVRSRVFLWLNVNHHNNQGVCVQEVKLVQNKYLAGDDASLFKYCPFAAV